ncbi:unnamed protein product [Adineta ricciae]|uniref:Uncharacterized protein n=1 Tax=Adineta ricciae TaxID=249248 RepID=A0A815UUU9_ADIRI|nr:unnamed protein product [Adineta ricciae]
MVDATDRVLKLVAREELHLSFSRDEKELKKLHEIIQYLIELQKIQRQQEEITKLLREHRVSDANHLSQSVLMTMGAMQDKIGLTTGTMRGDERASFDFIQNAASVTKRRIMDVEAKEWLAVTELACVFTKLKATSRRKIYCPLFTCVPMHPKVLFFWFIDVIRHSNFFVLEIQDQSDRGDNESEDRADAVKHKTYSTRLYILLFLVSFYIFFYIAMVAPQPRTVVISDVTITTFKKLYRDYEDKLTCPCTNTFVSHQKFVAIQVILHPVCSSFFVRKEWIDALFLANASRYRPNDFRSSAYAQFQLLSDFCSLAKITASQVRSEIDISELATVNALSEERVKSTVDAAMKSVTIDVFTRLMSFIDYININTRSNGFISALNINTGVYVWPSSNQYVAGKFGAIYIDSTMTVRRCSQGSISMPALLHSTAQSPNYSDYTTLPYYQINYTRVVGFVAACTPLESLFSSTLTCLYESECLLLLPEYFPSLHQIGFNATGSVLASQRNDSQLLHYYIKSMLTDEWTAVVNYEKYFEQCAPSSCSYATTDQRNVHYAITMLVSLYGGFTIILRLIAPCLISMAFKLQFRPRNLRVSLLLWPRTAGKFLKELNLYRTTADRTVNGIKKQQMVTRVYLILLAISFTSLLLFHTLNTETVTITISNPSLDAYTDLEKSYNDTLRCPCSTMLTAYERFVSLSARMHQLCSSDFVSDRWISLWESWKGGWREDDWRHRALSHFRLLNHLCQLANETITNTINQFLQRSYAASNMPSREYFNTELNTTLNEYLRLTTLPFRVLVETSSLFMQVDQPYMGWLFEPSRTRDFNLILTLNLMKIYLSESSMIGCVCATNSDCQSPAVIYYSGVDWSASYSPVEGSYLSSFVRRCSIIDSLLFSTLACFYRHSECFIILSQCANRLYYTPGTSSIFSVRPLVYDPRTSQYPPDTLTKTVVERLMIEQWETMVSYEKFYHSCAPRHCIYSKRIRTKNSVQVIIALVSIIGGLTASLRIIAPCFVKIIDYFKECCTTTRRSRSIPEQQVVARSSRYDKLKMYRNILVELVRTELINLNIFSARDFNRQLDQAAVKRLGRWSTLLYIILLVTGLVFLVLYATIQPQTITEHFDHPSLNLSMQLKDKYGNQFKCPCTSIVSLYRDFVSIKPQLHQICSSPFASQEWQLNITSGLNVNLSIYARTDYRRFLSAHLQFLRGLCQLSTELVNNTIDQLLSSSFITTELLSKDNFHERLDSTIEQRKNNASAAFNQLLFLIRRLNHGNGMISMYGTNFEYVVPWDHFYDVYAPTQAFVYDGCSCGRYPNCTSQATFFAKNSSTRTIPVKGLKVGCTPSESFFASTLECFYDKTCIDLIEEYTEYGNQNRSSTLLSSGSGPFPANTTLAQLSENLFVEDWLTNINYAVYFEQCRPTLCSHTFYVQFNAPYILTLLLGLQGGLSIVIRWICPILVQIVAQIIHYRKHRRNTIQPRLSETVSTNVDRFANNAVSISPVMIRCSRKVMFMCLMLSCIVAALALFSFYFVRRVSFSTTTISTTATPETTSSTGSSIVPCQLKFVTISRNIGDIQLISPVLADFNGDDRADIAFYSVRYRRMYVLLNNQNGTFQEELTFSIKSIDLTFKILAADFNNDRYADILFIDNVEMHIVVFLGYGNGTFQRPRTSSIKYRGLPMNIAVADWNKDSNMDVISLYGDSPPFMFFNGWGNGTFADGFMMFLIDRQFCPKSFQVVDFNRDGNMDIISDNQCFRGITIIFSFNNFPLVYRYIFISSGNLRFNDIFVADFNADTRLDLAVSSMNSSDIRLLFGGDDACCRSSEAIPIEKPTEPFKLVSEDFNCDGQRDIVFSQGDPLRIGALVALSNEDFETQSVLITELSSDHVWIDTGHFNSDSYPDLIVVDLSSSTIFTFLNACECCMRANISTNINCY